MCTPLFLSSLLAELLSNVLCSNQSNSLVFPGGWGCLYALIPLLNKDGCSINGELYFVSLWCAAMLLVSVWCSSLPFLLLVPRGHECSLCNIPQGHGWPQSKKPLNLLTLCLLLIAMPISLPGSPPQLRILHLGQEFSRGVLPRTCEVAGPSLDEVMNHATALSTCVDRLLFSEV